ncbi:hypothetical protein [Methylocaldum szegediense]|uniref:Uncharacterized protein n=1 Tax=Methylocaldum szegediense TaxID=73780 RepID=A0ABN8XDN1_9GAMM|nr:hypothetical protein [Methylocaldum szegediense]CAI8960757.1 protein of unknown function [Methylocaldum szegediense]
MQNVMLKVIDALAKFGLDKLERALIFGLVLVVALALATGTVQLS